MDIVAVPVAGGPGPSSGDRELLDVAKADGEETSREQAEMPVFMVSSAQTELWLITLCCC